MNKSILFCTGIFPPQIGGPATYVLKMAEEMQKENIKNAIITYSVGNGEKREDCGLVVYRVPWGFFLFTYIKYFLKVLVVGKDFDILYIQGSFLEGIPAVLANFFLKKKSVVRIGGIYSWELSQNKNWTSDTPDNFLRDRQRPLLEIFKSIDRFVISSCDRIIANSNYTKKLLGYNGISHNRIDVIYNAVDSIEHPKISKEDFKEKLGLTGKKIILSVGRFVPWKNFDKLISFSKELPNEYALLIVGDGPEEKTLRELISKNNLEKKVIILNKVPKANLYNLYQVADIITLISSFEGLSHVLIEAMRMNIPIIISNIEPNIEAVMDYAPCRKISINKEEFIDAIRSLEKNPSDTVLADLQAYDFNTIYKNTLKILCE